MDCYLGLDFGTTGARACVITKAGNVIHEARISYPDPEKQSPHEWQEALFTLFSHLPAPIAEGMQGIAIAGTSATVLLCNHSLEPISPALLYSNAQSIAQAEKLKAIAPPGHVACSASSGLPKFLKLTSETDFDRAACFMHQADWLAALLTGTGGVSDYHNALKTGYDIERLCWPEWVLQLPHANLLPKVVAPGTPLGSLVPEMARRYRINPACIVHAGTTDSIAAFIATGTNQPGMAVTSLGTTIVLKLLSERRVESAEYGVYSHRYGNLWLAGGASNAGGGVLRRYFSDEQLAELSSRIDPELDSPYDYYPLPRPGERFPINDPQLAPCLTPRPVDDAHFLHGLLQGLSRIEATGYARLAELGTTPLRSVTTCGGGARNTVWARIRERQLGVPVTVAKYSEAAYGCALLAARGGIAPSG